MRWVAFTVLFLAGTVAAQPPKKGSSVEGHVWNLLSGAPIRKATVELRSMTPADIRLIADTDAAGTFQFTGLPPGAYRLSARRAGFLDRSLHRVISLGKDEYVTDVEIRLPPSSVISGRVLDEEGEPEPGARVTLFKQVFRNGRKQWQTVNRTIPANDLGEYRAPDLAPGRYILQALMTRQQGERHYSASDTPATGAFYYPVYYLSAFTQREAMPVDVGLGSEVHGIDIRLSKLVRPPSVRVSGKVVGFSTDSAVVAGVSLIPADEAPWGGTSTTTRAPDYYFELMVPPGAYTIKANVSSGGAEAYGSQELTLAGDLAGVTLAIHPAPVVPAKIVLPDGSGKVKLRGVTVSLHEELYNSVRVVRSDSDGRLVLPDAMRPGRYSMTVDARSVPDGFFVQRVTLGREEIDERDFRILASAPLEIVLANGAGKIAGTVLDKDGKRCPASTVTAIPVDLKLPEKTSTEDDGAFRFTALRPGKYRLFAWEQVDDDLWQDPEFRRKYESLATDVTIGSGETQKVEVRLILAEEMK